MKKIKLPRPRKGYMYLVKVRGIELPVLLTYRSFVMVRFQGNFESLVRYIKIHN